MKQIGLLIGRLSYGLDRAMVGMVFLLVNPEGSSL